MTITPKNWSRIFDGLIILGDLISGLFLTRAFSNYFGMSENSSATNSNSQLVCGVFILLTAMYVLGLLLNRVNFVAEKSINFSVMDNIALMFNTVLFSAIFPLLLLALFPILKNYMVVFIIIIFTCMFAWGWLHWYIAKKVSSNNGGIPSRKKKILGFFLVFPFVIGIMLPVNTLAEGMRFVDSTSQITFTNAVWSPIFVGALLALVAWFMCYIPRKMLKVFTGSDIRSRGFFLALLIEYAIKISPLGNF